VVKAVHEALPPVHDPKMDLVPPQGLHLTPKHYAYLKISEGCNNRCTFCIIPSIRGDLVSRPAAAMLYEAERLVKADVKELLVISQDTSAYGVDLKYAPRSTGAARCGPSSSTSPRSWAISGPGCACTTSIPTRMWMT
jgi:ribosomal protein S12 methylthiotransferase